MLKLLIPFFLLIESAYAWGNSNSRFKVDLSTRFSLNQSNDKIGIMTPIGFDYHNTLSNETSDIGTLVMQLYATKINNLSPYPPFYDNEDDFRIVTRIFNFNYTALGRTLPNIKIGHIELPYGIEYRIGTNGTLKQYSHAMNLGPKADWGISLNKQHETFEYEVSLTTGGGQDFTNQNSSYIFTGYVGNPSYKNVQFGLSLNKSRIDRFERESIAFDAAYYYRLWAIFVELQNGSTGHLDYTQVFAELNYTQANNDLSIYLQTRYAVQESQTTRKDIILGSKYYFSPGVSVSVQVKEIIEQDITEVLAQLRWRF